MGACETHVGIVYGLLPGKARVRDAGAWPAAADSMIFLLKRRADIWVCRAQEKRQWDAALERYDAALAASEIPPPPLAAQLHSKRAAAHEQLGHFAEAMADCLRAIALERTYAEVGSQCWMPYLSLVGSLSDRLNTTAVVVASTAFHLPSMY